MVLQDYSPFQLVFGTKPKPLVPLPSDWTGDHLSVTAKQYFQSLKHKHDVALQFLQQVRTTQSQIRQNQSRLINKPPTYQSGQLVAFAHPAHTNLAPNSRKIHHNYIGPLKIHQKLDDTHVTLATLAGNLLPGTYHTNRILPWSEQTPSQPLTSHAQLTEFLTDANCMLSDPVAPIDSSKL